MKKNEKIKNFKIATNLIGNLTLKKAKELDKKITMQDLSTCFEFLNKIAEALENDY